jgi:hypothetical protein
MCRVAATADQKERMRKLFVTPSSNNTKNGTIDRRSDVIGSSRASYGRSNDNDEERVAIDNENDENSSSFLPFEKLTPSALSKKNRIISRITSTDSLSQSSSFEKTDVNESKRKNDDIPSSSSDLSLPSSFSDAAKKRTRKRSSTSTTTSTTNEGCDGSSNDDIYEGNGRGNIYEAAINVGSNGGNKRQRLNPTTILQLPLSQEAKRSSSVSTTPSTTNNASIYKDSRSEQKIGDDIVEDDDNNAKKHLKKKYLPSRRTVDTYAYRQLHKDLTSEQLKFFVDLFSLDSSTGRRNNET